MFKVTMSTGLKENVKADYATVDASGSVRFFNMTRLKHGMFGVSYPQETIVVIASGHWAAFENLDVSK